MSSGGRRWLRAVSATQWVLVVQDTSSGAMSAPTAAIVPTIKGASAHFDGTGSFSTDGPITSYSWDFGDGGTSTAGVVDHVYSAVGTYRVVLSVTDSTGHTGSHTRDVAITSTTTSKSPTASFTPSTSLLTVSLDGSNSTDPDGFIASYRWSFGDNTPAITSASPTVTHTYAAAGNYQVSLTVTDNSGLSHTTSAAVAVQATGSPTQPVATGDTGGTGTTPTGTNVVSYTTLTGPKFSSRVNIAGTTKSVAMPAGSYALVDFSDGTQTIAPQTSAYGAAIVAKGLLGSGSASTILQMTPGSSLKAGDVPAPDGTAAIQPTNNLCLLRMVTASSVVDGITLLGTEQGHLYNGLRFEQVSNAQLSNSTIRHVPGNSDTNPGQTISANFSRATGAAVIQNVTIDGGGVGAAGIALNSCSASFAISNLFTTGLRFSAGIVTWQQTGDVVLTNWSHRNSARALTAERLSGTITLNDPDWDAPATGHDITYSWESGFTGGQIVFRFSSPAAVPSRKLVIQTNKAAGIVASVSVYVGGVKQTAGNYVTFI